MPKIPLNPFLSPSPGESMDMITDGLKLVGSCLLGAGCDDMLLGDDDLRGLAQVAHGLREALQYENERSGLSEPQQAWDAADRD